MTAVVLDVENLRVRFAGGPGDVDLIDGVSFRVAQNQTLAIVGESGCGKSLTALSMMGLLPKGARMTSGAIRLHGVDVAALAPRARADLNGHEIAMIFQEPMTSLNPAFTIGDQICETIIRHRGGTPAEARVRAIECLRRVRIPAPEVRFSAFPHQLSGGMRQRVMIAMAIANDPMLLIADEPTTALDVTIQAQILALIRTLQTETGMGLVLITHDLGVVAEVADTVAVMYAGQIVEQGPVGAIFADPQHPYTVGLMGSVPSLGASSGRLATIPGSVPTVATMPRGCRFSTRCPFVDERCVSVAPPMNRMSADHGARCWYAPLRQHFGIAA